MVNFSLLQQAARGTNNVAADSDQRVAVGARSEVTDFSQSTQTRATQGRRSVEGGRASQFQGIQQAVNVERESPPVYFDLRLWDETAETISIPGQRVPRAPLVALEPGRSYSLQIQGRYEQNPQIT